ncbi:MAG: hypothetical protein IJZ13_02835, partial [Clostridia bacterium]|nr:hypothetical protein [Clostridia bacterium]
GYYDQAKEALLFFGLQEGGYVLLNADGKSVPPYRNAFDGLLYYVHQLYQYTMQTGDMSVFETVRENVDFMLAKMEEFRSQSPSGLESYRRGCYMFMSQADHLMMPGEAASPSIMMAYDYQQFAVLCRKAGYDEQAQRYEQRAASVWEALPQRVWNTAQECFYSHVDIQGQGHNAHYYTDLVFPQLYSPLEARYRLASLAYMKNSLMFPSHTTGLPLMRVGDYKPTIFANDNVMPVQMAEAASALLQTGDTGLGTAFMEAVSFASTIYTDSPCGMPERMNDEGRGEPNFHLGNGIGSFLYTYIVGLFGLFVDNYGKTLHVEPAFPDDWDEAALELPYGGMQFVRESAESIRLTATNTAGYDTLVVALTVPPCSDATVTVGGVSYPVELTAKIGHTGLRVEIPVTGEAMELAVALTPVAVKVPNSVVVTEGEAFAPAMPVLYEDAVMKGLAAPGEYCLYGVAENACTLVEIPVTVRPRAEVLAVDVTGLPNDRCRLTLVAEMPLRQEVRCTVRNLSMEDTPVLMEQTLQGNDGIFAGAVQLSWQTPAAYTALLDCTFTDEKTGEVLYRELRSVKWKGAEEKDHLAVHKVELGELAADEWLFSPSTWRDKDLRLGLAGQRENDPLWAKDGHWFMTEENPSDGKYRRFCLLCGGMSDFATCELVPGNYRPTATFSVGRKVRTLELLYAADMEARLTGSTVGRLILRYADGSEQILPLTVGKELGSIFHNFAKDTDKVPLVGEEIDHNDSASVL